MKLAALLLVFVLLLWKQQALCTSNRSQLNELSWEAARAEAKAVRKRNLQLAGLRRDADLTRPLTVPEGLGVETLPKATAASSKTPTAVGTLEARPSGADGQDRTTALEAGPIMAVPAAKQQPQAAVPAAASTHHSDRAAPAEQALTADGPVKYNIGSDTTGSAAADGQPRSVDLWNSQLLVNAVCFLLGWMIRGMKPAAANPQSGKEGSSQGSAATASVSAASLPPAQDPEQLSGTQQEVDCTPVDDPTSVLHVRLLQQQRSGVPANDSSTATNAKRYGSAAAAPACDAVQQLSTVSTVSTEHDFEDKQQSQQGRSSFTEAPSGPREDVAVGARGAAATCEDHHEEEDAGSLSSRVSTLVSGRYESPHKSSPGRRHHGLLLRRGTIVDHGKLRKQHLALQQRQQRGRGVQLVQQGQLVHQQHQQPVQLMITAPPHVVVPAMRVVQQLATGVQQLSLIAVPIVHHMQQLSSGVGSLISRMDRLLSWATEYDQQKRLAAQQVIGHNAGQIGLALLLVAVGVTALKVGRVWEVHQVCSCRSQEYAGGWRQRLTGTRHVTSAWLYASCCAQELGLYAAGLMMLYWLAKATLFSLLSNISRGRGNHVNKSWQSDLVVFKAVICAAVGAHIMHSLGAAWLPWLLLWWVWCSMQLLLQTRLLSTMIELPLVLTIALLLPLVMASAAFHPGAVQLQGWLMEVAPILGRLPNIRHMFPLPRVML